MTSINSIRRKLDELNPGTAEQQRIKSRLRYYVDADPQHSDQETIENIREDFPPEVLFSKEALSEPHGLYQIIRDYITLKGLDYVRHPESNRIAWGLIMTLYTDEREQSFATNQLKGGTINSGSLSTRQENSDSPTAPAGNYNMSTKFAHNMSTRFKEESKFSGKLGENFSEFVNNYSDACNDYELSAPQRYSYLHHLFTGEAKRFYREKVYGIASNYREAILVMQNEFNSITRQTRVRKHLQSLRLNELMSKKKVSVSEALEELRETITKFAPQAPTSHRTDEAKTEYLYKAVVGAQWAKNALSISQSSVPPWNFQQLYTALDAAWLQEQEEIEARQRDGRSSKRVSNASSTPSIFQMTGYKGQGMYAMPRRPGSKSSNPRQNYSNQNFRNNSRNNPRPKPYKSNVSRQCYNCGGMGHFIRDCPHPKNLLKNVGGMLKANPERATRILYEVCLQAEDILFNKEEEDVDLFFEDNDNPEEEVEDETPTSESEEDPISNHYIESKSIHENPSDDIHADSEIDPSDF